jgi:hypothetical protein
MMLPWFKRIGIFFIPAGIIGWIILLSGIVYSIYLFLDIDSKSHSASDTLINFAFRLIFIFTAYTFIGFITSRKMHK